MPKLNIMIKFALTLMMVVVPCIATGTAPVALAPWSYIPLDGPVKTADPVARVFEDRLYVYTALDHTFDCGPKFSTPVRREGSGKFCMPGFQVFSTNDVALQTNWTAHGSVLRERDVPWAYQPAGFKGSGRMFAPYVVKGDRAYHLFFSAPYTEAGNVIGVATSSTPTGKFNTLYHEQPIVGTSGTDPSVIKLPNGQWVLFTSSKGVVHVQNLNDEFTAAGEKAVVTGLMKGRDNVQKQGLFTEFRSKKLYLYYSANYKGVYRILQAVAKNPNNPAEGFWDIGIVINSFDKFGRNNKASVVTYKGKSWVFYHRHVAAPTAKWHARRTAFSPIQLWCDGKVQPITPPTTIN